MDDVVSYARMDRCRKIPQRMAVRKAYTCALTGRDSKDYAERLQGQGRTVADMGDPHAGGGPGRVGGVQPGTGSIMSSIGVSGLAAREDEDIARMGLQALGR